MKLRWSQGPTGSRKSNLVILPSLHFKIPVCVCMHYHMTLLHFKTSVCVWTFSREHLQGAFLSIIFFQLDSSIHFLAPCMTKNWFLYVFSQIRYLIFPLRYSKCIISHNFHPSILSDLKKVWNKPKRCLKWVFYFNQERIIWF